MSLAYGLFMESEKEYHIGIAPGEIPELVLLPGDPDRAKKIAEEFFHLCRLYFALLYALIFEQKIKGIFAYSVKIVPILVVYAWEFKVFQRA